MKLKVLQQFSIGDQHYAPYRTDIHGDGKLAPAFVEIEPDDLALWCCSQGWAEPAEKQPRASTASKTSTQTPEATK